MRLCNVCKTILNVQCALCICGVLGLAGCVAYVYWKIGY